MSETNEFRFLHTMIRVKDLEKSIDFYQRHLGMAVKSRKDFPSGEFTLVSMGYETGESGTNLVLTHNWGREEGYDLGNGFGHLAIGVPDIYQTCAEMEKDGVSIPRPPGPMIHGGSAIAFIEDRDGYRIELIQQGG